MEASSLLALFRILLLLKPASIFERIREFRS